MSKTQIGGNRIADQSIEARHLNVDLNIPESQLELNFPTHNHENKSTLDILINSSPSLVKVMDLKDIMLTILQVTDARILGLTLKNTIDTKADQVYVDAIEAEIASARGQYDTLELAVNASLNEVDLRISEHAGVISHKELDVMYQEVINARADFATLHERLDSMQSSIASIAAGTGVGTGTGVGLTIEALTPWTASITLTALQKVIVVPNPYVVGNNSLQVYEGPSLLNPGSDNDYVETSSTSITLNFDVEDGTVITLSGTNAGRLYQWIYRTKSVDGQTDIPVLALYRPNFEELIVFEDGLLLASGQDYIETSGNLITMIYPLQEDTVITICKRRY